MRWRFRDEEGDVLDAVASGRCDDNGACNCRRLEQPLLAFEYGIARVERSWLEHDAALQRLVAQVGIAFEGNGSDTSEPAWVDVDADRNRVRRVRARNGRVDLHVAKATIPDCHAQVRQRGIKRDEIERLTLAQLDDVIE